MRVRDYGLSPDRQDEVWQRWRSGESLSSIARGVDTPLQHVRRFFAQTGGVRPVPARRSLRHLAVAEREEVSRGLAGGPPRVVNAALAELVVRGTVRTSADCWVRAAPDAGAAAGPIEETLVEALKAAPDGLMAFELHRLAQDDVDRLAARRPRRPLTVLAAVATAGLSATLVLLGTSVVRPTPVTFATAAVLALSAGSCLLARRAARPGSPLLRKARLAQPPGDRTSPRPADTVGLGEALYGLSELPNRRAREALGHRPPPPIRPSRKRRARRGFLLNEPEPIIVRGEGTGGYSSCGGDGGGGGC
ncbi:TIGR04222 domain-containing membrane protein [Streptosporangium roseum]|nr:TIGR04222 domain-containing membrane protein [Streptosporangium roseum]